MAFVEHSHYFDSLILFDKTRIIFKSARYFTRITQEGRVIFKHSDRILDKDTEFSLPAPCRSLFCRETVWPMTKRKQITPDNNRDNNNRSFVILILYLERNQHVYIMKILEMPSAIEGETLSSTYIRKLVYLLLRP